MAELLDTRLALAVGCSHVVVLGAVRHLAAAASALPLAAACLLQGPVCMAHEVVHSEAGQELERKVRALRPCQMIMHALAKEGARSTALVDCAASYTY